MDGFVSGVQTPANVVEGGDPKKAHRTKVRRFITEKAKKWLRTDGQTDGKISVLRAGVPPFLRPTRIFR